MSKKYKMLINGKWLTSSDTIEVKNKFNKKVIGTIPKASKDDVNQAIKSAQDGFKVMSNMPAHQKSAVLEKTSALIDQHKEEIAGIIAMEAGKAWKYALGEVNRAVQTFKFASEEAKNIHGETVPMDAGVGGENKIGFFMRFPIGIVGAISPFNFPLNLVAHKVAPAIAAGNSVVLKPATTTPLTALRMGELLMEAGLPDGALNIIMGGGSTVGDWLVTDPRIAMVTFTGSPPVGKYIMSRGGLKKYTMELGANSAVILCDDADIDKAIPRCIIGSYANSGQVCISLQRIYIHKRVEQEFTEKFITAAKLLVVGDPVNKDCDVGPMIDIREAERVEMWIKEAVTDGAKIQIGGTRNGAMVQPTVLTNVKPEMKVVKDEIFGPVVSIIPFEDIDDVVHQVDDSKYGLQAGIYTSDISKAFKAVKEINVGGVIINDVPTYRVDHMPYGGNKESGIGREGLKYAVEEMTNIKMVCFNL